MVAVSPTDVSDQIRRGQGQFTGAGLAGSNCRAGPSATGKAGGLDGGWQKSEEGFTGFGLVAEKEDTGLWLPGPCSSFPGV